MRRGVAAHDTAGLVADFVIFGVSWSLLLVWAWTVYGPATELEAPEAGSGNLRGLGPPAHRSVPAQLLATRRRQIPWEMTEKRWMGWPLEPATRGIGRGVMACESAVQPTVEDTPRPQTRRRSAYAKSFTDLGMRPFVRRSRTNIGRART